MVYVIIFFLGRFLTMMIGDFFCQGELLRIVGMLGGIGSLS